MPGFTSFLKTGLQNGGYYRFRAYAVNFNGLSEPSSEYAYYVCTAPTGFEAPKVFSQSSSFINIIWSPPADQGGCRITSFAIYRSDGVGSVINTEVNSVDDPAVRFKPSLNSLVVTSFPASSTGRTFKFIVKVFTTQREALSGIGYFVLAGVPSKPTDKPVNDLTVTSDSRIKVTFANPPPNDNGSPILSYELQMDDGITGDFVSLVGYDSNSKLTTWTVSTNIIKGRNHRF